MKHTFFIAPCWVNTGLTSVSLGLVRALDRIGLRVGFCKPIAQPHKTDAVGNDRSSQLIKTTMGLDQPKPLTLPYAEEMISAGKADDLMEEVIAIYEKAAQHADVVIVEGLVPSPLATRIAQINAAIVKCLDAEVILVTTPKNGTPYEISKNLEINASFFGGINSSRVLGAVINKLYEPKSPYFETPPMPGNLPSHESIHQQVMDEYPIFKNESFKLLGAIPWNQGFMSPRTSDVVEQLGAKVIHRGALNVRRVERVAMIADRIPNMAKQLLPNTLLVTPADREEIIVAASIATLNGVPLAGLLLTGGSSPDERVLKLCQKALDGGLPILAIDNDSYSTSSMLTELNLEVPVDDKERIEAVMESIAFRLETGYLKERCNTDSEPRLSPPAFRFQLMQKANKANKRIVLPEGAEPRTIKAATICHERGIAQCILLGHPDEIHGVAKANGICIPPGLAILNPDEVRAKYVEPMVALRKSKGLTAAAAEEALEDTVVLGTMMLALDHVDGLVSGAIHTTANTIRPAFQLIKTAPGCNVVSSIFFMCLPDQVLVYGDCAVITNPTEEQLADIAIQSADSAAAFGILPRVAMISYSTGSSGAGEDVTKVANATNIAREKRLDLMIDGPLQYDAAAVESVGKSKAPNSPVAGRATVFIFPDLNTGNTTYKAVQRSANVISIGPMLQGLRKPVNDLSRGALVEDIVYTIALTAIQAEQVQLK